MANVLTNFLSQAKCSWLDKNIRPVNYFLMIMAAIFFILFIVAVCQAQKRACTRDVLGLSTVFI
jgi:hypothetical protein